MTTILWLRPWGADSGNTVCRKKLMSWAFHHFLLCRFVKGLIERHPFTFVEMVQRCIPLAPMHNIHLGLQIRLVDAFSVRELLLVTAEFELDLAPNGRSMNSPKFFWLKK